MTTKAKLMFALVTLVVFTFSGVALAEDISVVRDASPVLDSPGQTSYGLNKADYTGSIKVYLVEPSSRWRDSQQRNFEFGFLDFPIDESLNILDQTRWEQTATWDAVTAGFGTISESNIMSIAVIFNSQGILSDAYPNNGYYYYAYYSDAAAGAVPGEPGRNEVSANYTHTVFIEEGSATW